jgi:hypothetical protein
MSPVLVSSVGKPSAEDNQTTRDYIISKGQDPMAVEHRMRNLLDARGAQYPAEHNVGHLYNAKTALADHYRRLDPWNRFNPGIGRTTKLGHLNLASPASRRSGASSHED